MAHVLEGGFGLLRALADKRKLIAQLEIGALEALQIRLELLRARLTRRYTDLVAVNANAEHG